VMPSGVSGGQEPFARWRETCITLHNSQRRLNGQRLVVMAAIDELQREFLVETTQAGQLAILADNKPTPALGESHTDA
jgi:hypothetical protein